MNESWVWLTRTRIANENQPLPISPSALCQNVVLYKINTLYWVTAHLFLFCQLNTSWKLSCPLLLPTFLAFITSGYHSPLSSGVLTLLPPFLTCAESGQISFLLPAFVPALSSICNGPKPLLLLAFNVCNSPSAFRIRSSHSKKETKTIWDEIFLANCSRNTWKPRSAAAEMFQRNVKRSNHLDDFVD